MHMHKALHPRDDIDKLYDSRKEGGWRSVSIEDYIECIHNRTREMYKRVQKKKKTYQNFQQIANINVNTERKTIKTRKQK